MVYTSSIGAYPSAEIFKESDDQSGPPMDMYPGWAKRMAEMQIQAYIEQYGLDKVEHLMDIGFALDNHIDWHKGVFRKKYPGRKIEERKRKFGEFEDLLNIGDNSKRSVKHIVTGDKIQANQN